MGKNVYFLMIWVLALSVNAADLGTINVESSTIVGSDIDAKTEVSTVNVIDEKTIEKISPKNIGELLQTIPGITADVRNSAVEIHIRGIGQQEFMGEDTGVAIVIDGVPVLQNGGKVKFNLDEIESIKVIKGGASYLYGNTALAGAVIITTKKVKNKNSADISVEAGSYGYKNVKSNILKGTDKYSASLNINYTDDDSFWEDEGKSWTKSANGKFQYYLNDSSDITAGITYTDKFEAGGGSVTGVTNARLYPEGIPGDWSYIRDYYSTLQKYFVTYSNDLSDTANLKVNTYYYKDDYDYKSSPQDTDSDGLDDSYRNDNTDNMDQYGFKTEYKDTKENLSYMLGLDLGQRKLDDYTVQLVDVPHRGYAGESTQGDTTENRYALYGETKYKIYDKLTAIGNIRIDYDGYDYSALIHDYNGTAWSDTTTNREDSFTNISYRVGATYQLNDKKTFYSNLSTGFRNPTVEQIYKGDYDEDYINNPNLDVETTITYEVGIRGSEKIIGNTLNFDASVFVTDTKDIIGKVGGTYYSGDVIYYDNVGDARNRGVELSLKSDSREKVSFSLSYTYLDAYYTSHNPFYVSLGRPTYMHGTTADDAVYDITGNQLPRVPHNKLDIIVNYKFMPKWNLMTELYAQSNYYADETNLVSMPGYAKVNLRVDYNHNKHLNFFVKIDNILDKQYYRTVYLFSDSNYDGVLDAEDASITVDPGRVFYAGLKYTF